MTSYFLTGKASPPNNFYGTPYSSASSGLKYSNSENVDPNMYPNNHQTEFSNFATSSHASTNDAVASATLGIARLLNNVVSHPCMVLRSQCQVHPFAKKLHITPITFVPVVTHIISKDGFLTLWKGSIGVGVLWGLSQITEIVIADLLGLPRYIVPHGSTEKFWRHIWLKATTFLATTPFIISSFIEIVRSGVFGSYSSNDIGIFDIIFKGIDRIRYDLFGTKDTGRRFSVLYLAAPTVTYFTTHYLIYRWAYDCIYGIARRYVNKKPTAERTRFHAIMPEMFATMTSPLVADLILYPIETILHRLYIQGTRTLIDNLDNGVSATNITMKYNGFIHCFQSVIKQEGFSALYSGVGAVMLQCALQLGVIWTLRSLLNYSSKRPIHITPGRDLSSGPSSGVLAGPPSAQFAAVAAADEAEQATATTNTLPSRNNFQFHNFSQPQQNVASEKNNFQFPTFAQSQQNVDPEPILFFDSSSPTRFSDNFLLQQKNRFDRDS